MMKTILVTGRSIRQGEMVEGLKSRMIVELSTCEISPEDMIKMNLKDGDKVVLRRNNREIHLKALQNRNIPPGIVYVTVQPAVNKLIPYTKSLRGMMPGKGVEIEIEKYKSETS